MNLKIVCDANMPYALEAFQTIGDVSLVEGRKISPANVKSADILITRSTTKINRSLLEGSKVRFYGSGVIGTDHIDTSYLQTAGICWCGAPGCNAESVGQYITAALLWLSERYAVQLEGLTIGVIGVGNVGRRVVAKAKALGMHVLACDPPRQRDKNDLEARNFVALAELLHNSDIVTCHVPLTRDGGDPTFHMMNADTIAQMRDGTIYLNAARGPVNDTNALLSALGKKIRHAVIDTWEGEPSFNGQLMKRVDIGTPHIAGHSYEGKVNGTAIVYRAACKFLGITPTYDFVLPAPPVPNWIFKGDETDLCKLVLETYDIMGDDQRLRETISLNETERRQAFDFQRSNYPMRREFSATVVRVSNRHDKLATRLQALNFQIAP